MTMRRISLEPTDVVLPGPLADGDAILLGFGMCLLFEELEDIRGFEVLLFEEEMCRADAAVLDRLIDFVVFAFVADEDGYSSLLLDFDAIFEIRAGAVLGATLSF
mmetsp:Transcript_19949/g.29156  ORF Transcript_19949/g.29156 Transcript_19949/m.29156 type:complete len:105 (-) Transcript_19949:440-754(-)